MSNVTGWNELVQDGNIINASFHMYNVNLDGWPIVLLFLTFQSMVYIKTRNLLLMWVVGLFFGALFLLSGDWIKPQAKSIVGVILVLELAGVLYSMFKS